MNQIELGVNAGGNDDDESSAYSDDDSYQAYHDGSNDDGEVVDLTNDEPTSFFGVVAGLLSNGCSMAVVLAMAWYYGVFMALLLGIAGGGFVVESKNGTKQWMRKAKRGLVVVLLLAMSWNYGVFMAVLWALGGVGFLW